MTDGLSVAPVEAGIEALDGLSDRLQQADVSTSGSGSVAILTLAACRSSPSLTTIASCRLTLDQKYELCRSVGTECIQEDELRNLLEKKPNPVAYDGFEPSGRMHIAQVCQAQSVVCCSAVSDV